MDIFQANVSSDDVVAPMPFTEHSGTGDNTAAMAIATIEIPALKLSMKTLIHGVCPCLVLLCTILYLG